jgi:hypothetical protein
MVSIAELLELCGASSEFIAILSFSTTPFGSTILPDVLHDVLFAAHVRHMGSRLTLHDLFPDACPYLLSIYLQICPMGLAGLSPMGLVGLWDRVCRIVGRVPGYGRA